MPRKPPLDARELFPPPAEQTPPEYLVAHVDGGARGNPGPSGYGVVIEDRQGKKLSELKQFLGVKTNNEAEYAGLLAALEEALARGARGLRVLSDSELLVRQVTGVYKVRAPHLRELHRQAQALIGKLDWFRIEHVPRAMNKEADRLANEAMDRGR